MIKYLASLLIFVSSLCAQNQDSIISSQKQPMKVFRSFGFNTSSVSGLGLAYRYHNEGFSLIQLTGGIFSDGDMTASSLGIEYQYEVSKRNDLRYFLSLGLGSYQSEGSGHIAGGIGVGFELPVFGKTIEENMTYGLNVFYPAAYISSGSTLITFGITGFFFYNF